MYKIYKDPNSNFFYNLTVDRIFTSTCMILLHFYCHMTEVYVDFYSPNLLIHIIFTYKMHEIYNIYSLITYTCIFT